MLLVVMYPWPVYGGPLGLNFSNMGNGKMLMTSTQVFRIEPKDVEVRRMSATIRIARQLRRRTRAFLADARGLAAVELALILPIALMLMSLVVFGGQAYSVQRKVTLAATTVANIFAQANNVNTSTITVAELNQILAYPNLILYPYDGSSAAVVVSQLLVTTSNGTATGTVCGSWPNANGTARTVGSAIVGRSIDRLRLFRLGRQ